jgi:hypothetical protein
MGQRTEEHYLQSRVMATVLSGSLLAMVLHSKTPGAPALQPTLRALPDPSLATLQAMEPEDHSHPVGI